MHDLGYESSNSIFNLGTLFLMIVAYIVRLFFYSMVYALNLKTDKFADFLESEKKLLFYPMILAILIEGYMEFLITGYLSLND